MHERRNVLVAALATVLATLATVAACAEGDDTAPPPPSPGGPPLSSPTAEDDQPWILYETSSYRLALVRADGTGQTALADDLPDGVQDNPDWSPDGTRVSFVDDRGIWTVGADGTDPTLVVPCDQECEYLDDPAWSPDGASIAFSRAQKRGNGTTYSLEAVDIGSGRTRFSFAAAPGDATAGVAWSPDSMRVAFELIHLDHGDPAVDPIGVDLAVWDIGSNSAGGSAAPIMVADPVRFPETVAWSPDGRQLAFGYRMEPSIEAPPELFVSDADGSHLRQVTTVTDAGGWATHPDWSIDGATLVFSGSLFGTGDELLSVPSTGGTATPLGDTTIYGAHPKVQPTGD